MLEHPEVKQVLSEQFVFAELYTDTGPAKDENSRVQKEQFGTVALPLYLVLDAEGRELNRLLPSTGLITRSQFLEFLSKGFDAYKNAGGPTGKR